MAHAVLNINATGRAIFDGAGFCHIRGKYRAFAKQLCGSRVVLYQSGRQTPGISTGYFGTAVIEAVFDRPGDQQRCIVSLSGFEPFRELRPLVGPDGMQENGLSHPRGLLNGWRAAEDIREISKVDFERIIGGDSDGQEPFDFESTSGEELFATQSQDRSSIVRDPKTRREAYRAYNGRCAISQVRMQGRPGWPSGLVAAHLYPHALEGRVSVSAVILLAPSWHSRLDNGQILLNDDYTWSALYEDTDTLAITDRRLALPSDPADHPDRELLRRNRLRIIRKTWRGRELTSAENSVRGPRGAV